jgi:hypothetical protein
VAFQAPALVTGWPNPRITLVWGVTNRGRGTAVAQQSWSDRVYLSGSAWRDGSERQIGSWAENRPVPVGGSYWRTNSLRVPLSDSGSYYLILETDAEHALFDEDALNNTISVPVTFLLGDPPTPGTLAGGLLPDGSFQVDIYGRPAGSFTLEASTDLTEWERVADFICTEDPTSVLDPDAGGHGRRFYRVVALTRPQALRLGLPELGPGWEENGPELVLEGPVGENCRIESSINLQYWQHATALILTRSPTRFRVWLPSDAPLRFFRATSP